MTKPLAYGSLLLFTTALTAPAAIAQSGPVSTGAGAGAVGGARVNTPAGTAPDTAVSPEAARAQARISTPGAGPDEPVEVSGPGATIDDGQEIVVTGRFIPNPVRQTPEVVSVLSSADIARTGEGDISGALQRVTGLSVVGAGFVYVRGLGDRYSLALLNGLPLPSPEPLRRVVPLDLFPTSVIASSLVQKSYSVNYPGEFGGGVINLTTKAIPTETFLSVGTAISGDTETTGKLGYTYYGSDLDVIGYDDGARTFRSSLQDRVRGGTFGTTTPAERRTFAAALTNAPTTVLQRNTDIPANFSGDISAGTAFDVGSGRMGMIWAGSFSNSWRTRAALQQTSADPNLAGRPQTSFDRVITDNRIVANGLLGVGAEFGDQKIRWTNLYIHDTLKQGRLGSGYNVGVSDPIPGLPDPLIVQNTYWFERQLIDTQLVGEFKFDRVSANVRGTYANSKRKAPYERSLSYFYLGDGNPTTKGTGDVDDYINNLTSAGQSATIAFSNLNEDVYGGAIDLAWSIPGARRIVVSTGYNFNDTKRSSYRYDFRFFREAGALPLAVAQQRPDFLLSDFNIYTYDIQLRDISGQEGTPAYDASLRTHAGYGQLEAELFDGARLTAGVRYENGNERVQPTGGALAATRIRNDYWLPAATITWNFAEGMQARLHASKTIARPQFRELAQQVYRDFESDREFTGNPFLTDSKLTNAEARYEWYFGRDQRISLAGFYKKIDNPIETAAFLAGGNQLRVGFANAPEAQLYGGEVELQKYVPLSGLGGSVFEMRRLVLIGNYTYTQSKLKVDDTIVVGPSLQPIAANLLYRDGAPLTGQSDHLVNAQLGLERTDMLSQQTILFSYASTRVTNRGPILGETRQPDIIEKPGIRLDFVARQGVTVGAVDIELKFEARNLTRTRAQEYQTINGNRIDINTFAVGRSFSMGAGVKF